MRVEGEEERLEVAVARTRLCDCWLPEFRTPALFCSMMLATMRCAECRLSYGSRTLGRMPPTDLLESGQLTPCKPIMKWAGGKSQLLDQILAKMPQHFGRYIEPFAGGAAVFFGLARPHSVISDSNDELCNLYRTVAADVESVINALRPYTNVEEDYYAIRAIDWRQLLPHEAAARTIYLNRTCFNGLYRVNRKGYFNVPFGRYKNPTILDESRLREAAAILGTATILSGDYKTVLEQVSSSGDVYFLDPPYIPISQFSDFKRYTKEQFSLDDQVVLAGLVQELANAGNLVIATNSNHEVVHDLYSDHSIEVLTTRRNINSVGSKRQGQDVLIVAGGVA